MASVLYVQLESEFEDLSERYNSLLQEFRKTGDDEIFIDLDADLLILRDRAANLGNIEERYEVVKDINTLRSLISSLTHSAF